MQVSQSDQSISPALDVALDLPRIKGGSVNQPPEHPHGHFLALFLLWFLGYRVTLNHPVDATAVLVELVFKPLTIANVLPTQIARAGLGDYLGVFSATVLRQELRDRFRRWVGAAAEAFVGARGFCAVELGAQFLGVAAEG
jgi:hypothetical protein